MREKCKMIKCILTVTLFPDIRFALAVNQKKRGKPSKDKKHILGNKTDVNEGNVQHQLGANGSREGESLVGEDTMHTLKEKDKRQVNSS